jgi:hypothetical protein
MAASPRARAAEALLVHPAVVHLPLRVAALGGGRVPLARAISFSSSSPCTAAGNAAARGSATGAARKHICR